MDSQELGRARMQVRLDGARQALREAGEEYPEDQVREAYRRCYRTCHDVRAQERDVSFMEQIEIFVRHIDSTLLDRLEPSVVQRIATSYADSLFHHPPPPHPDAARVLDRIKSMGYRMGLISNTGMTPGGTFRVYMEQLGLLHYFQVQTFSDEVRLAKPSKEIFLRTAEALGVASGEVVHVGDHLLNDVYGAKQAGMKTVWIETQDEGRTPVDVEPDVTVPSLGEVASGIGRLASGRAGARP
jgi:putative hydrolase of the HAD superfamily